MAKTKRKSSSDFVWRANSLKEKRQMRKKRNEKKKREWRKKQNKTKRVEDAEVRVAMQDAQAEALRYKKLAMKYTALKRNAEKRNDNKILGHQCNADVKKIKRTDLVDVGNAESTDVFAKGVFGKCHLKMYQGHLVVAKEFRDEISRSEVINEAKTLISLSSHPGLPVVLGVDISTKPFLMVSLFYGLNESNTTLHSLLSVDEQFRSVKKMEFVAIIRQLCEVLKYLHAHQFLHNDIKCDNVVIYKDLEGLKPVLIDFGKACKIDKGKSKNLTEKQKKKFRERHSHIAPEIVEGTAAQTVSSDIFALGRIILKIGTRLNCTKIVDLSKLCTSENPAKRCTLSFLIEECDIVYKTTIKK